MADIAAIYDDTRRKVSDYVRGLPDEDLERELPATPGWTVRDVISHLSGDVACILQGDFPEQFFAAFGEPEGVRSLNEWTREHIGSRRDLTLDEVLAEWETNSSELLEMMSGARPWPENIPSFAGTIVLTDLAVHQQDIYGAFGDERDRDAAAIRIATAGYVAGMGWRLRAAGIAPLVVVTEEKQRVAGNGDPAATVSASRFEIFRALSGRRNPEQIAAFEWQGDAQPYIPYFYPYGVREQALVE